MSSAAEVTSVALLGGFRGSTSSDRSSQWDHKTTKLYKDTLTICHYWDVQYQPFITMNLSALALGIQTEKHKAVKTSNLKYRTPLSVLHAKHWGQRLFEEFISWYQQQPFLFPCPDFFGQANLRVLLAAKATDMLRGVWGFSSMWDLHRLCMFRRTCSRRSRRVCLQTCLSFGGSSNVWGSWANGMSHLPNLSHLTPLLRGNEGAVARPRVADR